MAIPNTIEIKFKGDSKGLTDAIKSLDKATKSLITSQEKLVTAGKKVSTQQKKTKKGLFDLGHSARQTGGAFSVLRSKLLLFNFAMALGVRQLSKFVKEASKLDSMNRAFNTLADGGMDATKSLDRLKEATNNTMSEFDLFQQANNAMILGVSQNTEEMAEMFDMAQRLGNALGRDTKESVESLITGIGRQSRLMLDNIGIIVKSEEAYDAFAEKLNISTDSLSDAQKKQAFLNATMESARREVKKLGKENDSSEQSFQRLNASIADASVEIGRAFIPLMKDLAELTTKFTDSVSSSGVTEFARHIASASIALVAYKSAVSLAGTATLLATTSTTGLSISLSVLRTALIRTGIGALVVGLGFAIDALLRLTDAFGENSAKLKLLTDRKSLYIRQIDILRNKLKSLTVDTTDQTNAMDEQSRALALLLFLEKKRETLISKLEKDNLKTIGIIDETKALLIQQAVLSGASKLDVLRLELGKEFVKNNRELIDSYIKEKEALEELNRKKEKSLDIDKERKKDTEEEGKEKIRQMKKLAELASSTAGSLVRSALMGRNLKEAIKHAIINMIAIVVQAKLMEYLTRKTKEHMEDIATGGTSRILRGAMKVADFLFGHDGGEVTSGGIKRFHSGGLANDEVPAVLQQGEFVLSKQAVDTIGLGAVRSMNEGSGGSVTNVYIQGGVVDEGYIRNELIPAINKSGLGIA
jgi:hypothetical protein